MNARSDGQPIPWAVLEAALGVEVAITVDRTVCAVLASYEDARWRDVEAYMLSEHISHAVCVALADIEPSGPATEGSRGVCVICRRDVGVRKDGTTRVHNRGDGVWGRCPGSRQSPCPHEDDVS